MAGGGCRRSASGQHGWRFLESCGGSSEKHLETRLVVKANTEMPDEERKKVRFGDDQILPESEQRLLEDEEEKLFTDQPHAAPPRVVGRVYLRAIVLIQTGLIILLFGTLVIGIVFRDEQLPVRCAAYLNSGSKVSPPHRLSYL